MNNTRSIKKLIDITTLFLISFLFIFINIQLYSAENIEENNELLFKFIIDNYKLESYAAAMDIGVHNQDTDILKDLPFRNLFHKLQKKLMDLAVNETKTAISKNTISEEMQSVMHEVIADSGTGFNNAIIKFREKFKQYPNTADLITLTAISIRDAKDIFELSNTLNKDEAAIKSNKEVLEMLFQDNIKAYKSYTEHNREILNLISNLANNEFKIKDITKDGKKEIKDFSEIMPYIVQLQKEE